MEAQQCVQLTGTNSSFGLNALINQCPSKASSRKVPYFSDEMMRRDKAFPTPSSLRRPEGPSRRMIAAKHPDLLKASLLLFLCFAGLVAFAERSDPIPSRTRPSNAFAPMVLCLKTWESRSSPGLQSTRKSSYNNTQHPEKRRFSDQMMRRNKHGGPRKTGRRSRLVQQFAAGWSSPVARQAHNLKAAGSNPAPATTFTERTNSS